MGIELFIARKLSLRGNFAKGRAIKSHTAPGVKIAVTGIALSYVIMLLSLAVVKGFKKEIINKVTGFEQQITITQAKDYGEYAVNEGVALDEPLLRIISETAPEAKISLSMVQPAMLKTDDNFEGLILKSLANDETNGNFIINSLIAGEGENIIDQNEENHIIISAHTANALNLNVGDNVFTHFFINENVQTRKLRVSGIYDTHFGDYDKLFAFTSLRMLQKLNRIDSLTGTEIDINGLNPSELDDITDILRTRLFEEGIKEPDGRFFHVQNVNMTGAMYFSWLALLDTNVIVILILMGCVSAFTLISSLFIVILQKVRTIGLLKALGTTNSQIRKIFILLTIKILAIGLLAGNIIGLGLLFLQQKEKIIHLDPEAYYLNYVPVEINLLTVILLNVTIIIISFLVLTIPSQIISKLSPAETMRYD